MFSDNALLVITIVCILFLVMMLVAMVAATRMKGGAGWAAVVIVSTTVPAYLTTLTINASVGWFLAFWFFAVTMNVLCMPALWFFVRHQFDGTFRFRWRDTLHFVPALVSLVVHVLYYAPLSVAEIEAERAILEVGGRNLPAVVNETIVFGQFFIYYTVIFLYIRKRRKYLQDNYSDSRILGIRWTVQFVTVFFALFLVVFLVYVVAPDYAAWIVPALNVIAMGYLVYIVILHSSSAYLKFLPAAAPEPQSLTAPVMSIQQMQAISDRAEEYLQTSKAYLDSELTLSMLSAATKIAQRNLSAAINGYLHKNFFDLVNEMRVGEAKRILRELSAELTTESIYPQCGFSSARSFFRAFQKFEGASPDNWRKTHVNLLI
jgi:AraC-like DNA-binding protein